MDKIFRPVCLMVILALVLSLGAVFAPQVMAVYVDEEPPCTADKWVTPTEIWQKGSGMAPEEATVTLTVTCWPYSPLSFVVYDVLPGYINLEGAFTITPNSITVSPDGTTTLEWYTGLLQPDQTWIVSFKISCDECGSGLLVNVPDYSRVFLGDLIIDDLKEINPLPVIDDYEGGAPFPEVYIDVLCPEVEPARIIVRNLLIQPAQAYPGQQVVISADVVNQGGVRGSKDIELVINGQAEQSTRVGVDPGAAEHITFFISKTEPGTYEVYIEGQASAFNVLLRPHVTSTGDTGGLSTGAIIAIVVIGVIFLVGIIIVFIFIRRPA